MLMICSVTQATALSGDGSGLPDSFMDDTDGRCCMTHTCCSPSSTPQGVSVFVVVAWQCGLMQCSGLHRWSGWPLACAPLTRYLRFKRIYPLWMKTVYPGMFDGIVVCMSFIQDTVLCVLHHWLVKLWWWLLLCYQLRLKFDFNFHFQERVFLGYLPLRHHLTLTLQHDATVDALAPWAVDVETPGIFTWVMMGPWVIFTLLGGKPVSNHEATEVLWWWLSKTR